MHGQRTGQTLWMMGRGPELAAHRPPPHVSFAHSPTRPHDMHRLRHLCPENAGIEDAIFDSVGPVACLGLFRSLVLQAGSLYSTSTTAIVDRARYMISDRNRVPRSDIFI